MRGINSVVQAGNVGEVVFGETSKGTKACSFMLAVEDKADEPVWVRVNVYGQQAADCERILQKGMYVVIKGELMNRRSRRDADRMVEIRGNCVVFTNRQYDVKGEIEDEEVVGCSE